MLAQLVFQKTERQQCAEYRHVQLLQNIGQCADMVLVPVGQNNSSDFVCVFGKIGNIGNDKVDSKHIILRKRQTAVDDDNVIAIFEYSHVLPDFLQSAKSDDLYAWLRFGFSTSSGSGLCRWLCFLRCFSRFAFLHFLRLFLFFFFCQKTHLLSFSVVFIFL